MLKRYYVEKVVDGHDPHTHRWIIFERLGDGKSRPVSPHPKRDSARRECSILNSQDYPTLGPIEDEESQAYFDRYIAGDR